MRSFLDTKYTAFTIWSQTLVYNFYKVRLPDRQTEAPWPYASVTRSINYHCHMWDKHTNSQTPGTGHWHSHSHRTNTISMNCWELYILIISLRCNGNGDVNPAAMDAPVSTDTGASIAAWLTWWYDIISRFYSSSCSFLLISGRPDYNWGILMWENSAEPWLPWTDSWSMATMNRQRQNSWIYMYSWAINIHVWHEFWALTLYNQHCACWWSSNIKCWAICRHSVDQQNYT